MKKENRRMAATLLVTIVLLGSLLLMFFMSAGSVADELTEGKVAYIGDSITYGTGSTPGYGFPGETDALLSEEWTYVNLGVPSEQTPSMVSRYVRDVVNQRPEYVVILAGRNDVMAASRTYSSATTIADLDSMISMANEAGIKVVLLTLIQDVNGWISPKNGSDMEATRLAINDWIKEQSYRATVLDVQLVIGNITNGHIADGNLMADEVHLNTQGNQAIARVLASYFSGGSGWAPTITSTPSGECSVEQAYEYYLTANESALLTAIDLPSWLILEHGLLIGLPIQNGEYHVSLMVVSSIGGRAAYQNWTIEVVSTYFGEA